MPKLRSIHLPDGPVIPVLYEDGSVLAIDKPPGWMLAPESWDRTSRNLHLALLSSLAARDFWARSRNLQYLRFIHRLDADTSGVLLLARNPGALRALSALFETQRVQKVYLAAVHGIPKANEWTCRLKLAPDPRCRGKMRAAPHGGKEAATAFRVLQRGASNALLEARPATGRTHQIRVHLAAAGHPVLGDPLYTPPAFATAWPARAFGLRAVALSYSDPFRRRLVFIRAPSAAFVQAFGFSPQRLDIPSLFAIKASRL